MLEYSGNVSTMNKQASNRPGPRTKAIQTKLQEQLEKGRMLRQQIECGGGLNDVPLTRQSDGDPRLRDKADLPPKRACKTAPALARCAAT